MDSLENKEDNFDEHKMRSLSPNIGDPEIEIARVLMNPTFVSHSNVLNSIRDLCYKNSCNKGFHDVPRSMGDECALIISEVSELYEAFRNDVLHHPCGKKWPDGIPLDLSTEEEECADIFIRLMDYCGKRNVNILRAVLLKMKYNLSRPPKHGGKVV